MDPSMLLLVGLAVGINLNREYHDPN